MPEGPELYLASRMVNRIGQCNIFSGKVVKSEVSHKNPDVEWDEPAYKIQSTSRGKEIKLTLTTVPIEKGGLKGPKSKGKLCQDQKPKTLNILFRFGMSGVFRFDPMNKMHKHAHLNFYTKEEGMVLSFVDVRRFGRWEINGDWSKERGPCVLQEYELFRQNVLNSLADAAFNRPICEVMLNQKYFSGIGNYLRAEILYRAGVKPFDQARKVLEPLKELEDIKIKQETVATAEVELESQGVKVKVEPAETVRTDIVKKGQVDLKVRVEPPVQVNREKPDLLHLCTLVPHEVIQLDGGKGYVWEEGEREEYAAFNEWLRCYYNPDMKNMVDSNNRTIWFSGDPGPMAPKQDKQKQRHKKSGGGSPKKDQTASKKTRGKVKELADHDYTPKVPTKRKSVSVKDNHDNGENNLPEAKQSRTKVTAKTVQPAQSQRKGKSKNAKTGNEPTRRSARLASGLR